MCSELFGANLSLTTLTQFDPRNIKNLWQNLLWNVFFIIAQNPCRLVIIILEDRRFESLKFNEVTALVGNGKKLGSDLNKTNLNRILSPFLEFISL